MITCKICKKFAKIEVVWENGAGEVKVAGSCKHCGYKEKTDYPKGFSFLKIPTSKVEYDDYEELGVEE